MTYRRLWTDELDSKLLAHVNARGKHSIPDACMTLRVLSGDDFQSFTVHAMVKHYEKLRHAQELEIENGCDELEREEMADEEKENVPVKVPKYLLQKEVVYTVDGGGQPCRKPKIETIGFYSTIPLRREIVRDFEDTEYGDGEYILVHTRRRKIVKRYKIRFGLPTESEPEEEDEYDEEEESLENLESKPTKFTVVKMVKVSGKMIPKTIGDTYTGEPPGKDTIEAILAPQYGGGEYIVINQTTKKVHKRFKFDGPPKDPDAPVAFPAQSLSPIVRTLDADKHPLIEALLLLPKARDNPEAWDRIFPRVLKAAEGVCADVDAARKDIDAARKEIEKVAFATRFVQTVHADKLEAVMDECDAALERNKLVDRELKKEN